MAGCGGWQSVNPLCRAGEVLGSAGKSLTNDVFGSIADYFAGVANSMVNWLWKQLSTATSVDLSTQWIKTDLLATGAIAALVAFALFLIQIIASVLRQEGGGLGRAVRGLGVAFIGAAFAIVATQILLAAVDEIASSVVKFALGTDLSSLGGKLVATGTLTSIGNPAGLLLMSQVLILAVVVIWVALMFRKMLIVMSAVFAPIAFSGATADFSKAWVRRWIEFTIALVASKLILVIIFMIGLSVLNGADQPGGGTTGAGGSGHHPATSTAMTNLSVGALTLLLAGFAPWIAIKMVHFAGDSFHTVHTHAGNAAGSAQRMTAAPQKVASNTRSLASTLTANGSSTKSTSGATSYPAAQAKSAGAGSAAAAAPAAATAGASLVAAAPSAAKAAKGRADRAIDMTTPPKAK